MYNHFDLNLIGQKLCIDQSQWSLANASKPYKHKPPVVSCGCKLQFGFLIPNWLFFEPQNIL